MLVLSRRVGESIVINDNIKVTIVSSDGNTIRVGIDAPKDIPIMRSELLPKNKPAGNKPSGGDGQ